MGIASVSFPESWGGLKKKKRLIFSQNPLAMSCGQSCSTKESCYRFRRPALAGENGQSWSRDPLSLLCGEQQWLAVYFHKPLSLPPTPLACFLLHWSFFYLGGKNHDQGNLLNKEIIWDYGSRGIRVHRHHSREAWQQWWSKQLRAHKLNQKLEARRANWKEHLTLETSKLSSSDIILPEPS